MKKIKTHRGFTIWKNAAGNYRVETPTGFFFDEEAANFKTARKWIDCHLVQFPEWMPIDPVAK